MLAAATVHFPYMTAWPERALPAHRTATLGGFARLAQAFAQARIETLVVFTSEHIVNLQPRLAPPFVIGIGARHASFPEPQFKLPATPWRGDSELARALVSGLYAHAIDVAHSSELRLDHGTTLPLAQLVGAGMNPDVAVIPIIINSIFKPLPTLQRCREFGEAVASSLRGCGVAGRVGVLATGGLSHIVGAPGMERNDPGFDEDFVQALVEGDLDRACRYTDAELDAIGNGTHEVRNWIAAAAAAQPLRARKVTSIAYAPGWDSGVHQLLWAEGDE